MKGSTLLTNQPTDADFEAVLAQATDILARAARLDAYKVTDPTLNECTMNRAEFVGDDGQTMQIGTQIHAGNEGGSDRLVLIGNQGFDPETARGIAQAILEAATAVTSGGQEALN